MSKSVVSAEPAHTDPHRQLLWDLSRGLHDLAQPLSALLANIELSSLKHNDNPELTKLTDRCLGDLARSIDCLNYLQELIHIAREESPDHTSELVLALRQAIEDLECVFQQSELRAELRCQYRAIPVTAEPTRLRQIFFYLLQMAQQTASPGNVVVVEVEIQCDSACVNLCHSNSVECEIQAPPQAQTQRTLVLAREIARSMRADLQCCMEPFLAKLKLAVRRDP